MRRQEFKALPTDNMIVFKWATGELQINQRYMETAMPATDQKKLDRLIKRANTPPAFRRR